MELIVIELFLWAGLIFFFWVLKDGLGQVETDIEDSALLNVRRPGLRRDVNSLRYVKPDKLLEAIGSYQDTPIYRYAIIAEQYYRFDHIWVSAAEMPVQDGRLCIAPGLVYVALEGSPYAEN